MLSKGSWLLPQRQEQNPGTTLTMFLPIWMSWHFTLWRSFSFSNQILINFDAIYSFSSPEEIKTKPLSHCPTSLSFHSEVSTSLKYTGWFNSEIFSIIQCLCKAIVHFSLEFKKLSLIKYFNHLFLGVLIIPFCFIYNW